MDTQKDQLTIVARSVRTGSVRTGPVRTGSVRTGSVRTGFCAWSVLGTAGASLSGGYSSRFCSSFALSAALASLTPVLNLDGTGKPLTFRSALAGPFGAQWAVSDGAELVKLVSSTRILRPVRSCSSSPTYYNRVVKEKWSPL